MVVSCGFLISFIYPGVKAQEVAVRFQESVRMMAFCAFLVRATPIIFS
jgi:hypothetical protein